MKLNLEEEKEAIDNPSIVHLCCCGPKILFKRIRHEKNVDEMSKKYQNIFYYYCK